MGLWIPGGLSDSGGGYVPCEWGSGTDAEIVEALEKHYTGEIDLTQYWTVGDERVVHLSNITSTDVGELQPDQDITLVILNVGGKELVSPINGHTECIFIIGLKDCLSTTGYMNSSNSLYGWATYNRRTWCNNDFYNSFPSTLKPIFKQHNNYVANSYSATTPTKTEDYFCLPSVKEVTGGTDGAIASAEANNNLLSYYETSSNRIKKLGSDETTIVYWTSSKYYTSSTTASYRYMMCYINTNSTLGYGNCRNTNGIAPQGVI